MRDPLVLIDQEVFHGHLQEPGQGQQVIHRGQALAVLPLINGLRVLKPEIGLQIPHGQPGLAAVPLNAAARLPEVDDRKCRLCVHRTILSVMSISCRRARKETGNTGWLWKSILNIKTVHVSGETDVIIIIFHRSVNSFSRHVPQKVRTSLFFFDRIVYNQFLSGKNEF